MKSNEFSLQDGAKYILHITNGVQGQQHAQVFKKGDMLSPLIGTTFNSMADEADILEWAKKCIIKNFYRHEEDNAIIAKLKKDNERLLRALKICWQSLQTYGEHPLIKNTVQSAIKKAESNL